MESSSKRINRLLLNNQTMSCLNAVNLYDEMSFHYQSVLETVETKLNIINRDISKSRVFERKDLIHQIQTRIKSMESLVGKLERLNLNFSKEIVETSIFDFAGIRVICNYEDDIYELLSALINQEDVTVLEIKDYISNPKPNGYKSLHAILSIPVYLFQDKLQLPIEVQFRTLAMDFWASLEHGLTYKKGIKNPELEERLLKLSKTIEAAEQEMMALRKDIEKVTTE